MTNISAGNPPRSFEEWAFAAARDLANTPPPPRAGAMPDLGSLSEVLAVLVSPRVLGPRAPDDFPGVYLEGGDPSGGALEVLYTAAFGPDMAHPDPAFRVYVTLNHEADAAPALEAVGLLVGEEKDTLLFSEPGLPLPEISCTTRADLQRLHARVLSAARRV